MTADDLADYRAVERARRARHLSRLRHRLDAAALLRRRPSHPDPQHSRRLRPARERRGLRRDAAPDDRGDEARLCGPRRISRRSAISCGCRSPASRRRAMRRRCAATIDPQRARPAREISAGNPPAHEGDNTTHYSVVDRDGNAVSNTYTLNFSYGLGLVADGTGVLLNNELDDFAAKAGAPNAYGLVGGDANAPGPGKRPLSSMTPDHRAPGRQAVPGHRIARRQPHHHHGAAGDPQRDRSRHEHRRGGRGAAHPSSMAAGRGVRRARLLARHAAAARTARPQGRVGNTSGSANSIMVTPGGPAPAPPTRASAARWRRGIETAYCIAKTGAGEGIRTLDPDLGKVVLYP